MTSSSGMMETMSCMERLETIRLLVASAMMRSLVRMMTTSFPAMPVMIY